MAQQKDGGWAVLLTEVFGGSRHKGSHGLVELLITARVEGAFHEQVCGEMGHGLVHGISLLPLHQFLFDVTLQHVHSFLKEKTGLTGTWRHSGLLGRGKPSCTWDRQRGKVHTGQRSAVPPARKLLEARLQVCLSCVLCFNLCVFSQC